MAQFPRPRPTAGNRCDSSDCIIRLNGARCGCGRRLRFGDLRRAFVTTPAAESASPPQTDYIVTEAVNLANARARHHVAARILDLMAQTSGIRIEWVGSLRFEAAKAFYRRHAHHRYSFTDCTSFIVMRELQISDALTTDRHFGEAGLRMLLP